MAVAHAAADELKAIAGMQSAVIVRVGEGKTMTIAAYDTEDSAAAAQPKIQSILGQLAGLLTAPPDVVGITFNLKLRQERNFIEIWLSALDISHGTGGAQKVSEYLNAVLE
jgi:hypothetical protein